jgi:DNA-binding response OmpR family regulator
MILEVGMTFSFNRKSQPAPRPGRFLNRGPITLDLQEERIALNGKTIKLPPCTFEYMVTLVRNYPEAVSYQQLVTASQGYCLSRLVAQDLARMRIYLLRKAIEQNVNNPHYILAEPGFGYRLAV